MPPDIVIREPTPDELPQLPLIEDAAGALFDRWADDHQIDRAAWPPSTLERLLSLGKPLVAVTNGKIAGFVIYNKRLPAREVFIAELGVHPAYQGRKIGVQLIEAVVEIARDCSVMTLTTFSHIPWNAPHYKKYLGFRVLPEDELTALAKENLDAERNCPTMMDRDKRVAMIREI